MPAICLTNGYHSIYCCCCCCCCCWCFVVVVCCVTCSAGRGGETADKVQRRPQKEAAQTTLNTRGTEETYKVSTHYYGLHRTTGIGWLELRHLESRQCVCATLSVILVCLLDTGTCWSWTARETQPGTVSPTCTSGCSDSSTAPRRTSRELLLLLPPADQVGSCVCVEHSVLDLT